MASALVAHGGTGGFGQRTEIRQQVVKGFAGQLRMLGHGDIQVVHIGLMMLVVVQMHGGGIDGGLERVVGIG